MRLDQIHDEVELKCEALCLPLNAWIYFASRVVIYPYVGQMV